MEKVKAYFDQLDLTEDVTRKLTHLRRDHHFQFFNYLLCCAELAFVLKPCGSYRLEEALLCKYECIFFML